ncbi:piggyBac transposable element-derived protein 4-like isoform X3 [Acanthaster planci]|uniref:PiggyBac transposable element-derived protein 4-like isoform X2 n=1 Tax=Acanthaster planci TaxID=133434 RepID=A0A8B7YJF0_ACAPL|nr:piggyBac transposable element-derived protein 4-like isoform X2 [Acanthaster planci]XP_022093379.1 piggyBac transposable element-derived protein 4-like isoform X3 [Acanthaster planci]
MCYTYTRVRLRDEIHCPIPCSALYSVPVLSITMASPSKMSSADGIDARHGIIKDDPDSSWCSQTCPTPSKIPRADGIDAVQGIFKDDPDSSWSSPTKMPSPDGIDALQRVIKADPDSSWSSPSKMSPADDLQCHKCIFQGDDSNSSLSAPSKMSGDDSDMSDSSGSSFSGDSGSENEPSSHSSQSEITTESDIESDDSDVAPLPRKKRQANLRPKGRQLPFPRGQGHVIRPPAAAAQPAQTRAPDGTVWSNNPRPTAKMARPNIMTQKAGPRNVGGATTPLEIFELFFPAAMLHVILQHTNAQGVMKRGKEWRNVALMELYAFLGLLLYLGLTNLGHERVRSFWGQGFFCRPLCLATMSSTRFQDILTMLRFDNKATRAQRKSTDKFAPIREIFEMFARACRRHFSPSESVTIDEQLIAFRGRCSFRQYMPKKPAKYGLKFWTSVDSTSHYLHNIQPYTGKRSNRVECHLGARVVKELAEPLFGTGRNITANTFFVSNNLANYLYKKNMTLVGTIKGNRSEVPLEMRKRNVWNRATKSSQFLFSDTSTLVSYVPKPRKNILLLSSMHHDTETHPTSKKPDILTYYNATKAGVHTFDQMCSVYNCARITRRWPMAVFYHLLNCAAINSFIIYLQVNPNLQGEQKTRHNFIHQLVRALVNPQVTMRLAQPQRLPKNVLRAMEVAGFVVQYPTVAPGRPNELPPQRRCAFCPHGRRRRTSRLCSECNSFSCQVHSVSRTTTIITCLQCKSAH